jgi:TonB family protein
MERHRKSERWCVLAAVMGLAIFLAIAIRLSDAQRGDNATRESAGSIPVTLWMQWQRGNNTRYGSNFVYLHTPCQNSEPCECSISFRATNSKEFADYISSFGENKVPVVYDVVYDADGRARTNQLSSVGTWKSDRFAHNDRLISVSAKFQGDAVGERQVFEHHGSADCFPSIDKNSPTGTSTQPRAVTKTSATAQQNQVDGLHIPRAEAEALLIKRVQPAYPQDALEKRIQGTVVLNAQINETGNVTGATLISGHPLLASSAIQAVKQWSYKPYAANGEPVAVETTVAIDFRLPRETHLSPSGPR